jgi:hypothetical protein
MYGLLITSVAHPDPGSGAILIPRSGDRKKIRIRNKHPGSYFPELGKEKVYTDWQKFVDPVPEH